MDSQLRIIVTGLIAQHPHMGGVAWDYVQYPSGLQQLGHDVYYFEDSGEWLYNLDGGASGDDWVAKSPAANLMHLSSIMDRFGLGDHWAYRFPLDDTWHGLSETKRREVIESADLIINVSGTIEHPERYRRIPRMAYIDSDPVFTQLKILQREGAVAPRVDVHDVHFSFGESFSKATPVTTHEWLPTRHPMVLAEWPSDLPHRGAYSTVMNWTSYPPLIHGGTSYGQKDVEFKRFLDLPRHVHPAVLEVALANTEHINWQTNDSALPVNVQAFLASHADTSPRDLLLNSGWNVVDPDIVCAGLDNYRDYIVSSKAEWSVAKNGYVAGRPGWFSCRSACYLAAGRPVVVQDTGFGDVIPTGEGVLAFDNFGEAVAAIHEVEAHYEKHARAARAIAEEYFDSDKVLSRLVDDSMNTHPPDRSELAESVKRGGSSTDP